ncbi:IS66 family insertion sequence element accessory protein TnpA [Vibrio alginolyticus]|uniref:IS66 family insertion sequence element accessory protein TnpA n=1 Tax=Vibrio alginolyticus TaxID=663 RepID=UPI002119E641|nr:hypothetical protein [Vibrio alginolyticus]MCQ9091261.1 hypothetical protein [Vibrio alginolyticus]
MSHIRPDEEWIAIFQEQQQSGLSVARFCKQNQLAPKTFRRRQKRLEEQEQKTQEFVKVEQTVTETLPSQVIHDRCTLQTSQFTLAFPAGVSTLWLAQLLRDIQL